MRKYFIKQQYNMIEAMGLITSALIQAELHIGMFGGMLMFIAIELLALGITSVIEDSLRG